MVNANARKIAAGSS